MFVPRWVGAVYRVRNLFNSPLLLTVQLKDAAKNAAASAEDLRRLGRQVNAREASRSESRG